MEGCMRSLRTAGFAGRFLPALAIVALGLPFWGELVLAADDTSEWSKVATPSHEDLVILPGSDIIDYATAGPARETLYAIGLWYDECLSSGYQYWSDAENVMNEHLVPRLWKSSDGGATWEDRTAEVQDAAKMPAGEEFVFFSAVAAAPDDEDFVMVAGYDNDEETMVVGSTDGADSFSIAGCGDIPGGILCMAVSTEQDGVRQIAAGTKDLPPAGAGGRVWRLEVGSYWQGNWLDTSDYDGWLAAPAWTSKSNVFAVTSLEFSPNFDYDETLVGMAIGLGYSPKMTSDPLGYGVGLFPAYYYFAGKWNGSGAWNGEARFEYYPGMFATGEMLFFASTYFTGAWEEFFESPFLRMATDIALPYDYTGEDSTDRTALVSINGSIVPAVAGMPAGEGGYLFLMMDMAPAFELLNKDDNPFVSSVAYQGSVMLMGDAMVGLAFPEDWNSSDIRDWYDDDPGATALPCCSGTTVLYTDTPITRNPCCPDNWGRAQKNPTGQFNARVEFNRDGSLAYASTQGYSFRADPDPGCYWSDESAFSVSDDRGDCWNQTGLIDTDIDFIADMAVNGACGEILLATVNAEDTYECCSCDSVWRSDDGGESFLRVWCGALEGDYHTGSEWAVLGLPPGEDEEIVTIYMADLGTGTVYYATFGGLCRWESRNTGLADIADIAVLDDATIYVLDADGRVAKSTSHARKWSEPEDSKVTDDTGELARSIACLGDWVLVGGDMGDVTCSDDGGDSYSVLDDIGDGKVRLAFDSYFNDNGYIYAAVAEGGDDNGVYRTTIEDADFENMHACDCDTEFWDLQLSAPEGNPYTDASTGGVLYVAYIQDCAADCPHSGVARCLNPAADTCCDELSWDYLFAGLPAEPLFHVEPDALDLCGCLTPDTDTSLFAIDGREYYDGWDDSCPDGHTEFADSNFGRLWQYTDCFAKAGPALIGVDDGATVPSDPCDCVNEDFVLEWDRICDACEYDVEIALDEGFKHKVWTTSTICATGGWSSAGCETHEDCGDMVLEPCESTMTFYKPSDPCVPSIVVPKATLDCNQQYWWRVRARVAETGEIYRSQWSDKWSFTVAVGPGGAIRLTAPDDGASNVPLESIIFTWTVVADATSYDLTLMDASGAEVASNSDDATSFVLGSKLDYDSAYMWQVNAMKGSNILSESGVSTFRTMSKPTAPPEIPETVINFPEPVTASPTWVWVVIALAAVLIIVVIVLVFRTRRV
jgi:hypothetical protein